MSGWEFGRSSIVLIATHEWLKSVEQWIIVMSERKTVQLIISGRSLNVDLFFSAYDGRELNKIKVLNADNCRCFVQNLILRHVVGYKDDLELNSISIRNCEDYIFAYLKTDPKLNDSFGQQDKTLSVCERFVWAWKAHGMHISVKALNNDLEKYAVIKQELFGSYFENLSPVLDSIKEYVDHSMEMMNETIKYLSSYVEDLVKSLSTFSIPEFSEDDKQRIINRYSSWGAYGWTSTDFLSNELLDQSPKSVEDANRIARGYLNNDGIVKLFEELNKVRSVRKTDLLEMKASFESRNYKSCVLIAFAMIDSKLIRAQGKKYENRKVGNEGIKRLQKRLKEDAENTFLLCFSYVNLFQCLNKLFENSANFAIQPQIINRHFVTHGMLHRKVTRRDAIQTILLVYNLYSFSETMGV